MVGVSTGIPFSKGHGTGNDFVVLSDPEGDLDLSPELIRALCDRRFGVGGDGVLRVVRTGRAAAAPELDVTAPVGAPEWFMDYRNSDGTVGETCGNGIRVFARFLVERGLAQPGRMEIMTRGGVRVVAADRSGDIAVDMGAPVRRGFPVEASIGLGAAVFRAAALGMPNPHAVVLLDSLAGLPEVLPAPAIDAADFPEGANVELATILSSEQPISARMRVYERGSGETLSCGTGACAVGVVVSERLDLPPGVPILLEVAGGTLSIELTPQGTVRMTGPAELLADGEVRADWWLAHGGGTLPETGR